MFFFRKHGELYCLENDGEIASRTIWVNAREEFTYSF